MSFKLWVGNISSTIVCLQKRYVVLCEWHEMHWATVSELEPSFLYIIELWRCCLIHNMFRHGRPRYFNIQLIQIFLYRKVMFGFKKEIRHHLGRFTPSFRISASTFKGPWKSHKWHTPPLHPMFKSPHQKKVTQLEETITVIIGWNEGIGSIVWPNSTLRVDGNTLNLWTYMYIPKDPDPSR